MKKITYVCDMCAHPTEEEGELIEVNDVKTNIISHRFGVTGRNQSDCSLNMEISIHIDYDHEFHICKECIIGQLENTIQELRNR